MKTWQLVGISALGLAFIPLVLANIRHSINLDGDLKSLLTPAQRDTIWFGRGAGQPDWFSGDVGQSTFTLGYDFSDAKNPFGTCDINFLNASGNRPMPFMSSLNGAFPKILLGNAPNLTLGFDVRLRDFSSTVFMRSAAVIALMDNLGNRFYFEQDIQDTPMARAQMPYSSSDTWETIYADIVANQWVHLDVPFEPYLRSLGLWSWLSGCFVESCYLVNECFGSGHVAYDVKNWWLFVG